MANTIIKGKGAPTGTTQGAVGQIYIDTDTGIQYQCIEAVTRTGYKLNVTTYNWILRRLDGDFVATDEEVKALLENAGGSKVPEKVLFTETDPEGNTLCCGRKCSEITKEEAYALCLSLMPFVMINEYSLAQTVLLTPTVLVVGGMALQQSANPCGGRDYAKRNNDSDIDSAKIPISKFKQS